MKRLIAFILALCVCASLTACSGRKNKPIDGNEDVVEGTDNAENADNTANSDATTPDANDSTVSEVGGADAPSDVETSSVPAEAPKSTESVKTDVGGTEAAISYGEGMEVSDYDGYTCFTYGDNRMFVKDVTKEYKPGTDDPAEFLYNYAYEKCVSLVESTYGKITNFDGEQEVDVKGNEVYGYGAFMTCDGKIPVYASITLVGVGNGYAVKIGVCQQGNMNVFDNVELG